ncbi:restriction endonuclease subunit S [uncultured Algoriphagus sp.]|uniref:restriction endonuclease subunit S n=1 Tax=uncultured Algoriphagus sp. TaxID=417365 RepID=UPI0025988C96|nr:restriction endonuclease subunit S [uncultured Algoriphagus sp.]
MKQGWEIKKLGEVCRFINGRAYSKPELLDKGKYPVLRVGNFFTNNQWYYSDLELDRDKYCDNGDLLYAWSASFGPRIWEGEKVIYHYHIWKVVPDENMVTKEFLFQLLNWDTEALKTAHGTGTTMMHIGKGSIEKRLVPIPPLPEQQRIVSILNECFAAIDKAKANAEQNLKNAKELFESYLQGVFENKGDGWEEKKVKEIGLAQTGTTPKTAEKENYGDFIPFIKPADVDFSGIGDIRYKNEGLSEIGLKKGRKMASGSILMVCIGATIGKVGFAEREVSCNQQINSLTVKKEFYPKFIYYSMTSKAFQEKVLIEGKGAQATLPIINKSKWENLTISFPKSKEEQQTIVHQLDVLRAETQKLDAVYQKKIEDLEELKKSILKRAFSGELTGKEVEI